MQNKYYYHILILVYIVYILFIIYICFLNEKSYSLDILKKKRNSKEFIKAGKLLKHLQNNNDFK